MEPSKYKTKDIETQRVLEEVYRNALGVPMTVDNVPDKDKLKSNVLTFHGADMYIKLPNGTTVKITGTAI